MTDARHATIPANNTGGHRGLPPIPGHMNDAMIMPEDQAGTSRLVEFDSWLKMGVE